MMHPDDFAANLPAPRDDEPRELRQDIADELADHLHCAVARERLRDENRRGRDEAETLQLAIEHFGDPAAIARRLWWDAMKEKIMSQRIATVVALAAGAACVACAVFMWQIVQNSRDAQAALLASQREMMQTMLAELKAPRQGITAESDNWQPLRVKLVDDEGHPVEGEVNCQGGDKVTQIVKTDAQGIADFGRLPTGQYGLHVTVKATRESHDAPAVLLGPGRPTEQTIVCPAKLPAPVSMRFEIEAPKDVHADSLYFVAQLYRAGRVVGSEFWNAPRMQLEELRYLLLDHKGKVLGEAAYDDITERTPSSGGYSTSILDVLPPDLKLTADSKFAPGSYRLMLAAYLPQDQQTPPDGNRQVLRSVGGAFANLHVTLSADGDRIRIEPDDVGLWTLWNNVQQNLDR